MSRNPSDMCDPGPLTEKVLEYVTAIENVVPTVRTPEDWAPVAALVDLDGFERVGTFLEVQDWHAYAEMLTGWATRVDRFKTRVRRISELPTLVYYDVEETHYVGDTVTVLNSLTVFEFNDRRKICHLDVFMQKAP